MYKIVLVGDAAVGKSNLLAFYTSSAEGKVRASDTGGRGGASRSRALRPQYASNTYADDGRRRPAHSLELSTNQRNQPAPLNPLPYGPSPPLASPPPPAKPTRTRFTAPHLLPTLHHTIPHYTTNTT